MCQSMIDPLKSRTHIPCKGRVERGTEGVHLQQLNFLHLFYFWSVARNGSIAGACKQLGVTQPTVSAQLRRLEETLGHRLFDRTGHKLLLTTTGATVLEYAEDLFSVGRELIAALRAVPGAATTRLSVGVPNAMPKLIIYRLLEPVLHLPQQVQIVCREANLEELVDDLDRHRFDVILSDRRVPPGGRVRSFHHALGTSPTAICGAAPLADKYRRGFPESLLRAPWLLPTGGNEMRHALDRWFDSQGRQASVIGEFDDSALLKEFGHAGAGLFPVPAAVLPEVRRQYAVEPLGLLPDVRLQFFAITTERKLVHPAVKAISQAAKEGLFVDGAAN